MINDELDAVAKQPRTQSDAHRQAQVEQPNTPPLLAAFAPFPSNAAANLYVPVQQTTSTLIHITDAGFNPPTLSVFGPTDVTWINDTTTTHTLRSGEPGQAGNPAVFLPLIQRGSAAAVEAAAVYLPYLYQQANSADFSATLAPRQSFTYRFTAPETYKFHLASALTIKGELTLSGVALLRASPANGEGEVAVTRETVLEFSGALDPATVTAAAFTVRAGSATLAYRLNLSADKRRVTLFYTEALPGSSRVRVSVDGSLLKDAQGGSIDVDGDGVAGGNAVLEFDTLSLTVIPGTEVCGRVFASELAVNASNVSVNTPLKDVTVSVDGLELQTKTDVNGNFCLNPAPAGRFFVHVDGHSATNNIPAGQYYPMVGKAWQSIPGQTTNVGDIFLPLVPPGTLQPVSAKGPTQITFPEAVLQGHPELNGVSILVPADSLFSDDGARGGKVGIAPVPPDRLPGGLPEGLNFPVVITVQTDGAGNFDTPASVCFPNLPDPNTGETLAPGAKDALYSFNHDTGAWEAVGSMTVTADGRLVCSDPGVGIRAPGWHGNGPQTYGPPPPPPPPPPLPPLPPPCDDPEYYRCEGKELRTYSICTGGALATVYIPVGGWAAGGVAFGVCTANYYFGSGDCETRRCPNTFETELRSLNKLDIHQSEPIPVDDPVINQLIPLAKEIQQLMYPYQITETSIPSEVQSQIAARIVIANSLTGGDVAKYINDYTVKVESTLGDYERRGNAPAYPILYMAEVQRPTEILRLRGKTDAYAQYSLFVPRDGVLRHVSFFDPNTSTYGLIYPYLRPNPIYKLPHVILSPIHNSFSDYDKDTLVDAVEYVYGTNPANPDTDGDGISDGAEVAQGTDPLGGFIAQTGIIGSADTPGTAVDICVQNDLAVIADSAAGVTIFNVFDSTNPKLIAQVDTPGNAQRVACANRRVAVADGDSGLAIVDISNVANARIVHQINLNGKVTAVTTAGNVAYAATMAGRIVAVDMTTGAILSEVTVPEGVQDLSLQAEVLYALTTKKLYALALQNNSVTLTGSADSPGLVGAGGRLWRLFVGSGLAYAVHAKGYNTFDITLPGQPVLRKAGDTQQFGWKQIVTNGAGVGVAAVGPNSTNDAQHNISLYDVSDPQQTNTFITQFDTPGLAAAVTLYKGRAYVADSQAGMQVINYLSYDNKNALPTITLSTNFAPGKAEEGALLRITANTTDDVQVRAVEFYIDGKLMTTDGNFPFEYRFVTPRIADQPSFNLRARAIDTGGNETWTAEQTITLVLDATQPRAATTSPANGGFAPPDTVTTVSAVFNEAMNPATVNANTFRLFSTGTDGLLNTADDQPVAGNVAYDAALNTVTLTTATALTKNRYGAVLSADITDVAGNPLKSGEYRWNFNIGTIYFENFSDLSRFTLNGTTKSANSTPVISNGKAVLRLTPDQGCISGSAFLSTPIPFSLNGNPISFSTYFQFQITGSTITDGLAFVLAPAADSLGAYGGYLGYSGIKPSLAVEFDTYRNGWDEDDNHVGIDLNGSLRSVAAQPVATKFTNGSIWHVWIDYNAPNQMLAVYLAETDVRPTTATLSYPINLTQTLQITDAYIGFSAGTCLAAANQDILHWSFSP